MSCSLKGGGFRSPTFVQHFNFMGLNLLNPVTLFTSMGTLRF